MNQLPSRDGGSAAASRTRHSNQTTDAKSSKRSGSKSFLWFLAPAALLVSLFTFYPILQGAQMAFRNWNINDFQNKEWIGLRNFADVLSSDSFHGVLGFTLVWVVVSLFAQLLIGFGLALLLRRKFRGRGIYQAFILFPWAMSGFLIGLLFRWMFNAEYGVFNDILMKAGLVQEPLLWLADPTLAKVAVLIANVWYGVPFFAIMILAALQSIPDETIEAAKIDGAGSVRMVWSIYVPQIAFTLVLTVLIRVIWIFNFPDIIFSMTEGGPAGKTHIVSSYMIEFTQQGNYGVASAVGVIAIVMLTAFTIFYLLASKRFHRED